MDDDNSRYPFPKDVFDCSVSLRIALYLHRKHNLHLKKHEEESLMMMIRGEALYPPTRIYWRI
jgi:hypothetical protein